MQGLFEMTRKIQHLFKIVRTMWKTTRQRNFKGAVEEKARLLDQYTLNKPAQLFIFLHPRKMLEFSLGSQCILDA